MIPLTKLDERYRDDPHFNRLVDYLVHVVLDMKFTPSEVREAAMYACLRVEMLFPRPLQVEIDERGLAELEATIAMRRERGAR